MPASRAAGCCWADIGANACVGLLRGHRRRHRWSVTGLTWRASRPGRGPAVCHRAKLRGSPARPARPFDPASLPARPVCPPRLGRRGDLLRPGGAGRGGAVLHAGVLPSCSSTGWTSREISVRPLVDDGSIDALHRLLAPGEVLRAGTAGQPGVHPGHGAAVGPASAGPSAAHEAGSWPCTATATWPMAGEPDPGIQPGGASASTPPVYSAPGTGCWGRKVSQETELSTAPGRGADMLTLGDECFIADAVMLGDEHIDGAG